MIGRQGRGKGCASENVSGRNSYSTLDTTTTVSYDLHSLPSRPRLDHAHRRPRQHTPYTSPESLTPAEPWTTGAAFPGASPCRSRHNSSQRPGLRI